MLDCLEIKFPISGQVGGVHGPLVVVSDTCYSDSPWSVDGRVAQLWSICSKR
jgi:hypothetical protein